MSNLNTEKTLADDFVERLSKTFRPKFIENVDNPARLVDYLRCLEPIDEEIVRAQQTQYGARHAASILYKRLVRKPDWIEDLSRALMEDDIGLGFLANDLKRFELTVPVRWNIACINGHCAEPEPGGSSRIADETKQKQLVNPEETLIKPQTAADTVTVSARCNIECINGHCSDPEPGGSSRIADETKQKQLVNPEETLIKPQTAADTGETVFPRTSVNRSEIKVVSDPDENVSPVTRENRPKTSQACVLDPREELRLQREILRQQMMEKVFSFMKTAEDVPVMIHYMGKINAELDRIDHGSIIFSFYIDSLEALEAIEKMWRYGGLKKLLDKDILNYAVIQELKAIGENAGHLVDDIKSEVNVFETDIERCRRRLLRTNFDILPFNIANTSVFMNNKPTRATITTREVAHFAFNRLPEELRAVIEDPFVSDRIERFYNSVSLHDIFIREQKTIIPSKKSVSQCFANWLNEELSAFLKDLDANTQSHVLCVAVYLVQKVVSGNPATIPYQPLSESTSALETVYFSTDSYDKAFWFESVPLPSQLSVDRELLLNACKELSAKRLICREKNELNFYSALLRDTFVAKVVLCSRFKGSMKSLTDSFDYVQTLIGMYKSEIRNYISHQAEVELTECAFKTKELREIGIMCESTDITIGTDSSFYNQNLVGDIGWHLKLTDEVADAGTKLRKNLKINITRKHLMVNLSTAIENRPECLNAALHWLNLRPFKYCHLIIDNFKITSQDIENIGMYLNATPDAFAVSMQNCQLRTELLTKVLQTGHFRNIRKLNIADNRIQLAKTQPLGLMHMRWLECLQIQNCNLGDEGIKILAWDLIHMENLRDINVANNQMTSEGLLQLVKAFTTHRRITALRIHKNYIGEEGSMILAGFLEGLILLEVLNISECGIGDKGSAMVAESLVSRSLRKLSMRKNNISEIGSRAFFEIFSCPPYFEHLDFGGNCLLETSEKTIAKVALDLSQRRRSFVDPFFKFLLTVPLIHLSLWKTNVGEKRIFRGLGDHYIPLYNIRYLCLQENNLTDKFVRDLTECILKSCRCLQHFNLRQNCIRTSGAMHIARALCSQRYLQEVLLDRNEIGDEGVYEIVKRCARLKDIRLINLSYNNISETVLGSIVNILEEIINNLRKEVQIDDGSFSSPEEVISVQEDKNKIIFQMFGDEMSADEFKETPHVRSGVTRVTKVKIEESLEENIFILERKGDTFYITSMEEYTSDTIIKLKS